MHNVLIVDPSEYKDIIKNLFTESGYRVHESESAFDAMAKLKSFDFDLIISEVELPGDNAFELYNYIHTNYPYIPVIMTTEKQVDTFFDQIFQEGIGNVLCKPLLREEILNLSTKLISKRKIFGLNNYMSEVEDSKMIRIRSSDKINDSINKALRQIEEWGFKIANKTTLILVLNELIINAVYHSYGYKSEKEERVQIKLGKDQHVDLSFAKNRNGYGIAVTDYKGQLSKMIILENIFNAIKQSELILRAFESGEDVSFDVSETGRGLDFLRKIAKDYYFIIKKDIRTEIVILFAEDERHKDRGTSLKIIENI
jgi:CheY-like chemotaxis protein